jgi:hypothetical protein
VARELGVRYVLEGGVRKAGNRIRITSRLIDTKTAAHIWTDRFSGTLDDIFELQEQIASSVAGMLEPRLELAEIERASRKSTELDFGHSRWIASEVGQSVQHGTRHFDGI